MAWIIQGNIKGPQGDTGPQGEQGPPGDSGDIHNLNDVTVTNYTESVVSLGVLADSCTLDLTNGTVQTATLTTYVTTVFTMPTPVAGKSFMLFIRQPVGSGGQGSVQFAGVHWPFTVDPIITSSPGKMDLFTFFSDGVNWFGSYVQGYDSGDSGLNSSARSVLPNPNSVNYPVLHIIRRAQRGRSSSRR